MGVSAKTSLHLPTGEVTFLFTDIEGSTRLWERAGGAMRRALIRHDELIGKAVERNAGVVFKTVGDSFFCVFERPENAVRAAAEAQFALAGEPWPAAIGQLAVRMGLHAGAAVVRRGDYFGPTLNRVARITAAAHGGQILASGAIAELVRGKLADVELLDLGTHRLKDLEQSEVIFQVVGPGMRRDVLAPATLDSTPSNLPSQISSFVGRKEDLQNLRALTLRHPLVTITGLGGIGKTRLALEFASESLGEYKDGCWFVALKDIDDPAQVAQATADALRIRSVPGEPTEERVVEALSTRRALIVIDNAEHLLGGVAAFVRRLLEHGSSLRIVVTSREPLHVTGEQVLRLSGLQESQRLFLERARSMLAELVLTDEVTRSVEHICEKLQGIPLAVELAAGRVATLSVAQLETLLTTRLADLGTPAAGDSAAQPLNAMLDSSYRLLNHDEKRVFARLSIFEGPFSLEAARAVAGDDGIDSIATIASLAHKSLVSHSIEGGESRYGLLTVVREYAAERLRASGTGSAVAQRYCTYYGELARSLGSVTPNSEATIALLSAEWSNIRNALRYALEEGLDVDLGRWAVHSLGEFWLTTGRTAEGWHWINRALELTGTDASTRASLLKRAAQVASGRQDFSSLEPLAKLLVEIHERSGDAAGLGAALQLLTNAKLGLGNGEDAEQYQRRALEQFRLAGDRRGVASALANLGTIAEQVHLNFDTAKQLLRYSLDIFRELEQPSACAAVLRNLGVTSMRNGDYIEALMQARESLEIFRRLGNEADAGLQHVNIAEIHVEAGRAADAISELAAARSALGEQPNRHFLASYYDVAFKAAVELAAYEQAARLYGYIGRHRRVARIPHQRSEKEAIESRRGVLERTLPAPVLDRLIREGSSMDGGAVEGLIERLAKPQAARRASI